MSVAHSREGGRGETSRYFAAGSQILSRWPRRSPGRCPKEGLEGACRSPRGSRAGLEAVEEGRGATMEARSQLRQDSNARLPTRHRVSAVSAARTLFSGHQRNRMTSCLALREVVPCPNGSPACLQTEPTNQDRLRWRRPQTTLARNHVFLRF